MSINSQFQLFKMESIEAALMPEIKFTQGNDLFFEQCKIACEIAKAVSKLIHGKIHIDEFFDMIEKAVPDIDKYYDFIEPRLQYLKQELPFLFNDFKPL